MTPQTPALPDANDPAWTQDRREPFPPLPGDTAADVVVVGAGIAGLTTALLLGRRGVDVLVLEALEVGAGTTGRTTAKVSALQGTHHQQVRSAHGDAVARHYAAAQVEAQRWMAETVAAEDIECDWEERTAATFAFTAEDRSSVESEAEAAQAAGLDAHLVDRCDELPFEHLGAVVLEGQAQFDPLRYLAGLVAACTATGRVRVHEGTRVAGVRGRDPVRVLTGAGTITAGHVVVTTLLPILDRGLHFAVMEPTASYCIAVDVDGPIPQAMYLSAGSPTRSLRTMRDAEGRELLVVGGAGHRIGRHGRARDHYEELAEWAAANFDVRRITHRWFAHDQVSVDHLPFAGPLVKSQPEVLGAGGFSKWGMTNATAAALVLESRICGSEAPAWAEAYEPHRGSRAGLKGTLQHNAETAADMAKGWLKPSRKVVCSHLGGVCAWNDAEATWDCPLHGSRYRDDGTVVAAPTTSRYRKLG